MAKYLHISFPFMAAKCAAARAIDVGRDPPKVEEEPGGEENLEWSWEDESHC